MGFLKNYIGQEYLLREELVCSDCFKNKGISSYIISNGEKGRCDFCKSENFQVFNLGNVIGYIINCLQKEYEDPANSMGWDGGEGGYQGKTFDTVDLFEYEGLNVDNSDLWEILISEIPTGIWCKIGPYTLSKTEELVYDWDHFCKFVKHTCRYVFLNHGHTIKENDSVEGKKVPLSYILNNLNKIFLDFNLITTIEKGKEFFRARPLDEKKTFNLTGKELGPPPGIRSKSSRLSAAGIPVFYGAENLDICLKELKVEKGHKVAFARFKLLEKINIIDFTNLPSIPEIFDNYGPERKDLIFLHKFLIDLIKPIEKDGKEHIEYVPTQIISEYIRYELNLNGFQVLGIKYPSSLVEGSNYCLFFESENIKGCSSEFSISKPYLEMIIGSEKLLEIKN